MTTRAKKPAPPARSEPAAADEIPAELVAALARSAKARRVFEALPPSHRRQWQRWIAEAKQEATRQRRAAKAVEQLATGAKDPRA